MSMKSRKRPFLPFFLLVLFVSSTAFAGETHGGPAAPPTRSEIRNRVFATVEKIESDSIFFKAEDGTVRDLGMKEARREGIKKFNVGEWVALEINDQNNVMQINRASVGIVQKFDPEKRKIAIHVGEDSHAYHLEDAALGKLADARKGARVKLELDRHNRVIDAELG